MIDCDRAMIVTAGDLIGVALGLDDEHEPRAVVAMSAREAREFATGLLDAARFLIGPDRVQT